MVAIIDIMASFIIGGIILIMSTKMSVVMSDNGQQANVSLAAQENCVTLSKMLESDLSKTGHKKFGNPMVITDSTRIKFYADIDDNGTLDSVTYYSGPLTSSFISLNPRHLLMYRTWNTKTTTMNLGVTKFKVLYYDSSGATTTQPSMVRAFRVKMDVESVIPMSDTTYAVVHWEQYIKPKAFQFTFN
jgi:hypothetical protein